MCSPPARGNSLYRYYIVVVLKPADKYPRFLLDRDRGNPGQFRPVLGSTLANIENMLETKNLIDLAGKSLVSGICLAIQI